MHLRPLAASGLAFGLAFALVLARLELGASTASAGTAVRFDERGLAETADLVLEGRVLAATPELDERGRIVTELRLAVDRTLWGEHVPERVVKLPGGVLPDGTGLVLAGMPRIVPGEEVLLFLSARSPDGVRLPTGLAQGKLRVVRLAAGGKVLVRDAAELGLLDPRTGTVVEADGGNVLDYAAVHADVAAGIAARLARGELPGPAAGEAR